jgi:shikimate kinase
MEQSVRNVILIGFMGTGKSSVGRALAERAGWTFVDTDAEIEREAGQTIPAIFAEQGEAAFRELETKVLTNVLHGTHQVVATGGGAVLAACNRDCMKLNGLVVALTASEEVIVARVANDPLRPLLAGNVRERVQTLLTTRKDAYRFADMSIDTDALAVDAIVSELIKAMSLRPSN